MGLNRIQMLGKSKDLERACKMGLTSRILKEKENNPKQNQANNPISEWPNETAHSFQ